MEKIIESYLSKEYLSTLSTIDLYNVKNIADDILSNRARSAREALDEARINASIAIEHCDEILLLRKEGKDLLEIANELKLTPFQVKYAYKQALENEYNRNKVAILEKLLDIPELPPKEGYSEAAKAYFYINYDGKDEPK